jgi:mono/diheme cytochrome c family protein
MRVWIKRTGYGLGTLAAVAIVAVGVVYAISEARFKRQYSVAPEQISLSSDSAVIARGAHLVSTVGCADCHGDGLRGAPVIDAPPMGRLVALNLTKGQGGVGSVLTPELIERAVRHGIGPDGRALRIMPADDYQHMSDDDMRAVIAYMTHAVPVDNVLAPTKLMLLPRVLLVAGVLPLLPAEKLRDSAEAPMSVVPAATKEYGSYLAWLAGCRGCHGPNLSGGKIAAGDPSWPPASNITPSGVTGIWTEAQFIEAMRSGKRPDGSILRAPMPWKTIGRMTDDELHALWLYLQSVPRREYGNH